MAKLTKRQRQEAWERADAICLGAALEHKAQTKHETEVFQGEGWGCRVCDPDLFISRGR